MPTVSWTYNGRSLTERGENTVGEGDGGGVQRHDPDLYAVVRGIGW
ncbi:hypothetical protein ACFXBB_38925 [Streptomyces scopuliridis]